MIKVFSNIDELSLMAKLNDIGPSLEVLSIYAINQIHFAWVKIPAPAEKPVEAKARTKGTK